MCWVLSRKIAAPVNGMAEAISKLASSSVQREAATKAQTNRIETAFKAGSAVRSASSKARPSARSGGLEATRPARQLEHDAKTSARVIG